MNPKRQHHTEYELYVPLFTESGRKVPAGNLTALKKRLTDRFGGLTYFPQRNVGLWKVGGHVFRDRIVILRVLADSTNDSLAFWRGLKKHVEAQWRQETVLIVSRRVKIL